MLSSLEGGEGAREPRAEGEQRRSRRGGRRRRGGRGGAGRSALGGSPTQPEFDLGEGAEGNVGDAPVDAGPQADATEAPSTPTERAQDVELPEDDTARMEAPRFDQPSVSWSAAVPQSDAPPAADRNE
jgi:hypothetical protein